MAGTVENAAIDRSSSDSQSNSVNHHNKKINGKVVNHLCYYTNHNHRFNGNHLAAAYYKRTGDLWKGENGGGENYHMVVKSNFNGGGGGGGGEAMKREMRDLEELLSKLNPMAKEFVPPSLLVNGNHNQDQLHFNNTNYAGLPGGDGSGFGFGYPNFFLMQQVQMDAGNGNGQMMRRKKSSYGQGRQRMNNRTSMAQREEVIRRTVYVCDIDQQVTEEQLAGLFLNCGQVVDCRVCGDPNSILRFAFVEFTDEEGARVALTLSGTMLGFYPVRVLPSKTAIAPVNPTFLPRSEDEREMCARTIYCTNIDKKITQADVKLFFESICGEVYRIRLLGDYQHSTRIAFVEFVMAESAVAALNYSGAILGTLPLRISPSKTPVRPRSPRPAFN